MSPLEFVVLLQVAIGRIGLTMELPPAALERPVPANSSESRVNDQVNEPTIPELATEWRARERATRVATHSETVAAKALRIAHEAQEAARDSRVAADTAKASALESMRAADKAGKAALLAADVAGDAATTAEGDLARARQAVAQARQAESTAADRFHSAHRDN